MLLTDALILFFVAIIFALFLSNNPYSEPNSGDSSTKETHPKNSNGDAGAVPSVQIDTYDKCVRLICRIPKNAAVGKLNAELLKLINTELKKKKINLNEIDILTLKQKIKIKDNFVIIKLLVCKKNKCNCC